VPFLIDISRYACRRVVSLCRAMVLLNDGNRGLAKNSQVPVVLGRELGRSGHGFMCWFLVGIGEPDIHTVPYHMPSCQNV